MKTDLLITGISQLATAEGAGARHGRAMSLLTVINDAAIAISAGKIDWVGAKSDWVGTAAGTIDLGDVAVLPGLIDPHTHAIWAGDRLGDFEARVAGATYEQILLAGGGIRSTVRATAAASIEELVLLAKPRVETLLRSGATTLEVKSGYGFTVAAELAMLEAIALLAAEAQSRIVATLLIHLPPEQKVDRPRYLAQVCSELIPEAARRGLATALDVFVEREAWLVDEAEQMFAVAKAHGLAVKLHSDQFHSIGGTELGVRAGALSVDHLEAAGQAQIKTSCGERNDSDYSSWRVTASRYSCRQREATDRCRGCRLCWNRLESWLKSFIFECCGVGSGGPAEWANNTRSDGCRNSECGVCVRPPRSRPVGGGMSCRLCCAAKQGLARVGICSGR